MWRMHIAPKAAHGVIVFDMVANGLIQHEPQSALCIDYMCIQLIGSEMTEEVQLVGDTIAVELKVTEIT